MWGSVSAAAGKRRRSPPRSSHGPLGRFYLLPVGALLFILTGLLLHITGRPGAASVLWSAGLALTGMPVVWRTLRGVAAGRFAADLVAMLAIVTALILREPLAGLIVVLMQTGGEALERHAPGSSLGGGSRAQKP